MAGHFPVNEKQIEELALQLGRKALGTESVALSPMMSPGRVNYTYRIDGQSDRVVARLNTEADRAGEFLKEQWAMRQARSVGVLTPEVLAVGRIEDTCYQVQSYVDGRHPAADDTDAWSRIGVALRTIHSVRTQGWGGKLNLERETFAHSWEEHVRYGLGQLGETDKLRGLGLLDTNLSASLETAWNRDLFGLPCGLTHGDVSVRNVLLDPTGEVVFIDWGCCSSGLVPYRDVIDVVGEHDPLSSEFGAFLKGYGSSWSELEPEIGSIATLGAIDLCRWAIDQRPDQLPRCLSQAEWALDVYWRGRPWRPRPDTASSD